MNVKDQLPSQLDKQLLFSTKKKKKGFSQMGLKGD